MTFLYQMLYLWAIYFILSWDNSSIFRYKTFTCRKAGAIIFIPKLQSWIRRPLLLCWNTVKYYFICFYRERGSSL